MGAAGREGDVGFSVIFYRGPGGHEGPVWKEYLDAVTQPKERNKIDARLAAIESFGFQTAGVRFEKIAGGHRPVYELKISAFGSEHRFLAGFAETLSLDGKRILILLRYVKKKSQKLKRTDIDTASQRLAQTYD